MQPESLVLVALIAIITVLYGTGISWTQERFGKFQDFTPRMKQFVNSLLSFIVPLVAAYLNPYWQVEFGNLDEVLTSVAYLLAPVAVWVVSQVAHYFDVARK